jgi:hypothetical protein
MFSYTYQVKILGTYTDSGQSIDFTTAVRKLPTVSYIARHLNKREIESILNKTNENGVPIGHPRRRTAYAAHGATTSANGQ